MTLTPSLQHTYILYGRKIAYVPYHVTPDDIHIDPDFGDDGIQVKAKKQAALLQHSDGGMNTLLDSVNSTVQVV